MVDHVGRLLALAALAWLLLPGSGRGQAEPTTPPPAPVDLYPRQAEPTAPEPAVDAPRVYPPLPPFQAPMDTFIAPDDPLLVRPGQGPGWFADAAVGIVKPHVNSHVNSGGNLAFPPVAGVPAGPLRLPVAPLDWSAMPTVEAGYRFGQGAGAIRAAYSFLNSSGTQTVPGFDLAGAGVLHSRLSVNRFDLDYATSEFLFRPPPNLWRTEIFSIGVSAADVFFDSQASGGQILHARASNSFAGVGPSVLYGWSKTFPGLCPVSLYGRIGATALFGKTRQHFAETVLADGTATGATIGVGPQSNGVGIFLVESGLSYAPCRPLRFLAGYHWERWWWVGATDVSNADLTIQGVFLRAECQY